LNVKRGFEDKAHSHFGKLKKRRDAEKDLVQTIESLQKQFENLHKTCIWCGEEIPYHLPNCPYGPVFLDLGQALK